MTSKGKLFKKPKVCYNKYIYVDTNSRLEVFLMMIDIHSHILPGIDDGAKTEAESIAMGKAAVKEGITTIVATPHNRNGSFNNSRENILNYTEIINELFKQEGIPLEVLPGQETRINGDMISDLEQGELLPINDSKYLFVELPSDHVPQYTEQMLFDIQVAGYIPVIVHPERNQGIIEHPNRLYEFIRKGALSQITSGSLIGKFGKEIQKVSHQLIQANLTHFIASDAHNTTTRAFWMKDAFDEVKDTYGIDLYYFFLENSQLMVDQMNVNRLEPMMVKRKKFLGLF